VHPSLKASSGATSGITNPTGSPRNMHCSHNICIAKSSLGPYDDSDSNEGRILISPHVLVHKATLMSQSGSNEHFSKTRCSTAQNGRFPSFAWAVHRRSLALVQTTPPSVTSHQRPRFPFCLYWSLPIRTYFQVLSGRDRRPTDKNGKRGVVGTCSNFVGVVWQSQSFCVHAMQNEGNRPF